MRWLKAEWYWYGLVIVIFLCVMEITGILGNWPAIVLVAVTMIYAMLVRKSISQTSNLQEKDRKLQIQFRKEDREIEFKRRQLDWIVNTAREIKKELVTPFTFEPSSTVRRVLKKELLSCQAEWSITREPAKIFEAEFEKIVEKVTVALSALTEEEFKPLPQYAGYINELNQALSNVLESALKIESELGKTSHT